MNYKRILLKLSGEVLRVDREIISQKKLKHYAQEAIQAHKSNIAVVIVLGGGNIYRGTQSTPIVLDRIDGDYMGMLATMINSIALYRTIAQESIPVRLMTQIDMKNMYEPYSRLKALSYLKKRHILIIGGGMGKSCFTTDSAASLLAIELGVDVLIKGTQVDGAYTKDPKKDPNAQLYKRIQIKQAIKQELKVIDMTALNLCAQAKLPIIIYNAKNEKKLLDVLKNPNLSTLIHT